MNTDPILAPEAIIAAAITLVIIILAFALVVIVYDGMENDDER